MKKQSRYVLVEWIFATGRISVNSNAGALFLIIIFAMLITGSVLALRG